MEERLDGWRERQLVVLQLQAESGQNPGAQFALFSPHFHSAQVAKPMDSVAGFNLDQASLESASQPHP